MADLRCRMCGKANPDTRQECEFCGARLSPLNVRQGGDSAPGGIRQGSSGQLQEEESQGWLARLREQAAKDQKEENDEEDEGENEEPAPDWLNRLRLYDEREPAAPAVEDPSGPEPDWLSRIPTRASQEGTGPAEPFAETPGQAENSSREAEEGDWLSRLHKKMELEESRPESEPAPPFAPESRRRIESLLEGETVPLPEPPPETPDWLASIREKVAAQPEPEPFSEIPDWLISSRAPDSIPTGTVEAPVAGVPAWLAGAGQPAENDGTSEAAASPADLETTPGQEPAAPRPVSQPPEPASEKARDVVPGAMPDWLAGMRPQELARLGEGDSDLVDEHAEWSGPLAGMRGILRAEPVIALPQKPNVARTRLEVSDLQNARAELLRGLVEDEIRQIPARARKRVWLPLERWLVSLALIVAVLAPIVLGTATLPRPDTIAPETLAVGDLINQLPPSAPVLVAFEYDPASIGELDLAGEAVVDHLMVRGARLVTLSTRPAGAGLALRLFEPLAIANNYLYGENYVHLGFVAGEGAGLSAMARNLPATAPADFAGNPAWSQPALGGIDSLADFALVVVISATPEGVRQWLEQAKPAAGPTPFVAVISAGAEPLVRPYYEGSPSQLAGLIAGVFGAGGYEQLTERPGEALARWDAYGYGVLAASVILLLGLVLHGAAGALSRNQASRPS